MIHGGSLNEKHDCNDVSTNSMKVNCANDHDRGDDYDASCDLENLFEPVMNLL